MWNSSWPLPVDRPVRSGQDFPYRHRCRSSKKPNGYISDPNHRREDVYSTDPRSTSPNTEEEESLAAFSREKHRFFAGYFYRRDLLMRRIVYLCTRFDSDALFFTLICYSRIPRRIRLNFFSFNIDAVRYDVGGAGESSEEKFSRFSRSTRANLTLRTASVRHVATRILPRRRVKSPILNWWKVHSHWHENILFQTQVIISHWDNFLRSI